MTSVASVVVRTHLLSTCVRCASLRHPCRAAYDKDLDCVQQRSGYGWPNETHDVLHSTPLRLSLLSSASSYTVRSGMSTQDWNEVVLTKKKPSTGTTVKDIDAVRAPTASTSQPSLAAGSALACRPWWRVRCLRRLVSRYSATLSWASSPNGFPADALPRAGATSRRASGRSEEMCVLRGHDAPAAARVGHSKGSCPNLRNAQPAALLARNTRSALPPSCWLSCRARRASLRAGRLSLLRNRQRSLR